MDITSSLVEGGKLDTSINALHQMSMSFMQNLTHLEPSKHPLPAVSASLPFDSPSVTQNRISIYEVFIRVWLAGEGLVYSQKLLYILYRLSP